MDRPEWLDEKYLLNPLLKAKYGQVSRAFEECLIYKATNGRFFETACERYADLYEELVAIWEEIKSGD